MNFWYLLFIIFFFIFVIESGKIRPTFDEIFGNGWDKNESEQTVKIEQNQQNEQNENMEIDQMGEEMANGPIDQMRNDQNHSKSNQNIIEEPNDQQKREIVKKFDSIREKLKKKGNYQCKNQSKIERKIAKLLGTNRELIQKWKNELNLKKNNRMKKSFYDEKKRKFIERIDEFKELYGQGKQKEFAKELGISHDTFWKWKKELVPKYNKIPNKYSNEDKAKKMKQYFKIKEANPKMSDEIIAKELGIGSRTLIRWKKKYSSI